MSVQHVNSSNFETVVKQSEKPVLVDFWASWCGPCRMIAPAVEEVAAQRPDILVCKVNVDEAQELAISYGVSSIPTLLVFKNGQVVNKSIGAIPKEKILELL